MGVIIYWHYCKLRKNEYIEVLLWLQMGQNEFRNFDNVKLLLFDDKLLKQMIRPSYEKKTIDMVSWFLQIKDEKTIKQQKKPSCIILSTPHSQTLISWSNTTAVIQFFSLRGIASNCGLLPAYFLGGSPLCVSCILRDRVDRFVVPSAIPNNSLAASYTILLA